MELLIVIKLWSWWLRIFLLAILAVLIPYTAMVLTTRHPQILEMGRHEWEAKSDIEAATIQSCPERLQHVLEVCERKQWAHSDELRPQAYWRLLVDDKHKVLYCAIPKAACSSFKTLLVKAYNPHIEINPHVEVHSKKVLKSLGLRYLNTYSVPQIKERLETYQKFMVVRHPWDRLLSAYQDKFVVGTFYPRHNIAIIKDTFANDSLQCDKKGNVKLTFSQFLELIAMEYEKYFHNIHWATFYELCHPCDISYDKMIKLETVTEDMGDILSWLNTSYNVFPNRNTKRNPNTEMKLSETSDLFKHIKPDVVKKLITTYQKDFELFGYSWSQQNGAQCQNLYAGGGNCC